MRAFANQMQIEFAEQRSERVGVFDFLDRVRPVDAQTIRLFARQLAGEETVGVNLLQLREHFSTCGNCRNGIRAGQERAHHA